MRTSMGVDPRGRLGNLQSGHGRATDIARMATRVRAGNLGAPWSTSSPATDMVLDNGCRRSSVKPEKGCGRVTWSKHRERTIGPVDVRRVRVGCEFVYVAAVDTSTVFQIEPEDAGPVSLVGQQWSSQAMVTTFGAPLLESMIVYAEEVPN